MKRIHIIVLALAVSLVSFALLSAAETWWILQNNNCVDTSLAGARNLAPETLEKQFKCVREYKQGDATRSVMALKCMVNGTEQSVLYGKTRYLCFELKKSMDKTQKRDDIPTRSDSY